MYKQIIFPPYSLLDKNMLGGKRNNNSNAVLETFCPIVFSLNGNLTLCFFKTAIVEAIA